MTLLLKVPMLSLVILVCACRSDPIRYHTLTPAQYGKTQSASAGSSIRVERVTVPPQVDRSQIVIRQGDSSVAILETEWWSASLADEIQSALSDQLDNRPAESTGIGAKTSLWVEVQRFDSVPGRYALLGVKWRLRSMGAGDDHQDITCSANLQSPSGASIDDLVMAQQSNVQRLATAIRETGHGKTNGCPSVR